ncbi:MAG TPA: DUF2145 domain-containing protein [Methylibium sp.]|uniref:DUF2145 domain-containing protein n=1 Tax=Methylibium sp. TaxID=2067992 RepID=UPI002DB5578F|nr:DUF2145 domain-containing protein [Methylibium sp.]HEU4458503.1 DUF2145 domain-containing protein [Methylibium sp.]
MSARHMFVAAALAAALIGPAHAGRSCEAKPPTAVSVQRAMTLAERTAQRLDASGAQVVVIARNGQDLGRWGLRWSHLGFAYKDGDRWRVAHKLNQCGSARGSLYRQGLGEFFLDDLHRYEAGIAVLAPEVQTRLLPILRDNARLAQLDTPAYSMVAYPWAQRYQQSNQWAIEELALSQEPGASSRERAQAWLQFKGYEPGVLRIDALTRLGARVSAANVAFDDHPAAKRYSDRIETVTADSVFAWLERSGLAARVEVLR